MRKGGREGGDVEHQKVQKSEVVKHRRERGVFTCNGFVGFFDCAGVSINHPLIIIPCLLTLANGWQTALRSEAATFTDFSVRPLA